VGFFVASRFVSFNVYKQSPNVRLSPVEGRGKWGSGRSQNGHVLHLSAATELAVGSPDAAELVRAYDDACRLDTFHFLVLWPEHSPAHILCALAKLYEQHGNTQPTRGYEATLVGFELAPGAPGSELVHFGRMTSVHLPASVSVISGSCFSGGCSLASIKLESGSQLSQLEADAFDERGLTSIHLPASVTVIGESCFSCCR
jgi:hypothetical protein